MLARGSPVTAASPKAPRRAYPATWVQASNERRWGRPALEARGPLVAGWSAASGARTESSWFRWPSLGAPPNGRSDTQLRDGRRLLAGMLRARWRRRSRAPTTPSVQGRRVQPLRIRVFSVDANSRFPSTVARSTRTGSIVIVTSVPTLLPAMPCSASSLLVRGELGRRAPRVQREPALRAAHDCQHRPRGLFKFAAGNSASQRL
jgi:hypothetical protein